MIEWEYDVEQCTSNDWATGNARLILSRAGEIGWELVTVQRIDDDDVGRPQWVFIYKKPVEDLSPP